MTSSIEEKLFVEAKKTKLDKERKSSIRNSILLFIKENPVPAPSFSKFRFFAVPAMALSAVFLITGLTAVKADSALPGEILYPIKIGVNEKVMSVLAFSDEAKAKLSIEFTERRLEEAEKLAFQGKISNKIQSEISVSFEKHTEKIEEKIEKLANKKISSDLEISLKAHSQVLETLKNSAPENILDPLMKKIEDRVQKIESKKTKILERAARQTEDDSIAKKFEEIKFRVGIGTEAKNKPGRKILNLSNQGLNAVPMDVFEKTDLVDLNLSGNNLTGALQAEVGKLKNLKIINLSNNKFTGVPAEIGQLEKLEILDLSSNQLTGLPYELGNLSNLKILNVSGNPYSEQDLQKITETLPKTRIIK